MDVYENKPVSGEFYRHVKGGIYQIKLIAKDSSDGQEIVVYQAMYPPYTYWVRKLTEFFSPVDHKKYPDTIQETLFEKIDLEQMMKRKRQKEQTDSFLVNPDQNNVSFSGRTTEGMLSGTHVTDEELEHAFLYGNVDKFIGTGMTEEELSRRGFMLFLDADSYRKKRQIFMSLQSYLSQIQINNIAVTLDLVLEEVEREDQCDAILKCLGALEHYEGGRLR